MKAEIKILRNSVTKRLVLVDYKTGQAFISFGKKDPQYKFFEEHHSDIIADFKPAI